MYSKWRKGGEGQAVNSMVDATQLINERAGAWWNLGESDDVGTNEVARRLRDAAPSAVSTHLGGLAIAFKLLHLVKCAQSPVD
jgi:hypothetical protein